MSMTDTIAINELPQGIRLVKTINDKLISLQAAGKCITVAAEKGVIKSNALRRALSKHRINIQFKV